MITVGILSLQGNFAQHERLLQRKRIATVRVRSLNEIAHCNGLIIPGGESTVIGMLLQRMQLFTPLQKSIINGFPVFGVCAGAILLAKHIKNYQQRTFATLDITIIRNGYGRQIASFESQIAFENYHASDRSKSEALNALFIRAPIITAWGAHVLPLAYYQKKPVIVQQNNMLACTFHPELKVDSRLHTLFAHEMIVPNKQFVDF